mgnify:CR=1 FL=1
MKTDIKGFNKIRNKGSLSLEEIEFAKFSEENFYSYFLEKISQITKTNIDEYNPAYSLKRIAQADRDFKLFATCTIHYQGHYLSAVYFDNCRFEVEYMNEVFSGNFSSTDIEERKRDLSKAIESCLAGKITWYYSSFIKNGTFKSLLFCLNFESYF